MQFAHFLCGTSFNIIIKYDLCVRTERGVFYRFLRTDRPRYTDRQTDSPFARQVRRVLWLIRTEHCSPWCCIGEQRVEVTVPLCVAIVSIAKMFSFFLSLLLDERQIKFFQLVQYLSTPNFKFISNSNLLAWGTSNVSKNNCGRLLINATQ